MRPTGYVFDVVGDSERVGARPIAGMPGIAGVAVPSSGDWRNLTEVVLDQMRSEACVWHAVGMALFLRGKVEEARGVGPAIPMPSVMQPWVLSQWGTQRRLNIEPDQRYATNVGSVLGDGLAELHKFGIVSSRKWPLDERLSWSAPEPTMPPIFDLPLDVDVAAADAKLTGDYGASGKDFPLVARAALAQGHFPVLGFEVCDEFFALSPARSEYFGPQGRPVRGRHMMVADAWRPGFLRFRGSYGAGWGDAGWVWVSDDYCASSRTGDGAVITATPRIK